MVAREFPSVHLIANERNIGFGAANNQILREVASEYVLLLNPDTAVSGGVVDALLALMDTRPEIGMCGPRLEQPDGTFDHASRRSFPTITSSIGHFTGIGKRLRSGSLAAYRAPETERGAVDALNGAFMLIRTKAMREVGLFDERYWMYMEDLDLCYRFGNAGWAIWFEPSVVVRHTKAGTSGKHRSLRLNYAFHYGMYRFYRDHYASERTFATSACVYVAIAIKFAASAARSWVARELLRSRPS